ADFPIDERERIFQRLTALLQVPIDTVIENVTTDAVGSLPSDLERVVIPPKRKPGLRELVAKGQRDPFTPVRIKDNVPREVAFYLEENRLDFPGVVVGLEPVREYVEGALLSHILGYTGHIPRENFDAYRALGYAPTDQVGLTGLESAFEAELRGAKGRRYIEVDVTGREVALLGSEAPTPGRNLILTVDSDLQKTVQTILQKGLRNARAKQGVAIALDPRNGDVLAMVTLPSYDDNLFATGISVEALTNLIQDPLRPLVNHAITGQYPPGSVFKMIPASAALQERVVDINTRIQTPGTIWVPHKYFPDDPTLAQPFYDWYKPGFGSLAIRDGIAWSSDVFFYKISGGESPSFDTGLGEERLAAYARTFGIGELTGIDLPGEAKGLVPDPTWKRKTIGDIWTIGDTYNMGIGQGYVLATPLQIANMTAAVANGGTLYKPQLVHDVRDAEGRIARALEPQALRQVRVDPQNLAIVREGMRDAVMRGTAIKANLADVNVAAKTGTAEYYGPKVNGHLPTHAWFTAFAPYENPQIVITVFVYGGGEGSEVAAPIAADILRAHFHLPADSPLASASAPSAAPPVVVPRAPAPGSAPTSAHKYTGKLLGVDGWNNEQPGIFGTVIDTSGRGVAGVRVVTDKCDSNVVFTATTDANGAFNFNALYWKDSARWCVRTVAPASSEPFAVEVLPYKRYTVQFVPVQ
ncbi:MAG: penicillin-binding protein 2, partial [Anaerolineales bacterium]|nr:penicillin-binding protein 2 [Anaerolineales bacterium]